MALWGAPISVDDPEVQACQAALDFDDALKKLNAAFKADGKPEIVVRVGIHVGKLFIGNIGCPERMNYTVVGTPANIAARIEQLGKSYGLSPLISGDVHEQVSKDKLCIWLDNVILRGHKILVTPVYHLVTNTSEATPEQLQVAEAMKVVESACKSSHKQNRVAAINEALKNPILAQYYQALRVLREKAVVIATGRTRTDSAIADLVASQMGHVSSDPYLSELKQTSFVENIDEAGSSGQI